MKCTPISLSQLNPWHRELILTVDDDSSQLVTTEFVFDLQRFDGEKTEEPTSKKREDARKKGQVARSQELNTGFVLLIGFLILRILWEYIYVNIAEYTVYIYTHLSEITSTEDITELFIGVMILLAKTVLPIMFAILIVGLAINCFQVGLMFSTEKLEPKLENLNPINGFGRIFSKRAIVELFKSLFKIVVIGYFLYLYLKDQIPLLPQFIFFDLPHSLATAADIIFTMAFQVVGVIMIMAVADYAYQRWQTTQDLKMSKQEVKDEMKQMEGDPQIKGKIKQKQRQMAMQRMMQEVPKADVIITNPTHLAIALSYKKGMIAPVVLAKGQDLIAERIKQIAREHHILIVENKPVARALFDAVEVGAMVPAELYQAVAEILAYVYRIKHRRAA